MKQISYWAIAAVFVLVVACNRKEEDLAPEAGNLTVLIEQSETRTSVDDVDGKVTWNTGDKIAVHVGNAFVEKEVTITGTDGATGHVEIVETPSTGTVRNYYAVYPSTAASESDYGNPTLTITLPSTYDITGKGDDYSPLPLVAVNNTADGILRFYHVGGLLRVYCYSVPKGTRSIRVTVDKSITGTYEVQNLGAINPCIFTSGETANNSVVYTIAGEGGLASEGNIILNVPVPCGTYTSFKVSTHTTADASGTAVTEAYAEEEHTFARHHGWRVPYGDLSLVFAVAGPGVSFNPDGETLTYNVKSYRKAISGDEPIAWKAEFIDDEGTVIERPFWLTEFTVADDGSVTAKSFNTTAKANESIITRTWKGPTTPDTNVSKETAIDLSLQDIYGTAIAQSTANCYVVSKPGWYKFPCVYGNALKFGSNNTSAYTSTLSGTGSGGTQYLTHFVRHDDLPITDPWISQNKDASNNNFVIASASLVWQDSDNLISQVLYEDDYVYFQIGTPWQGNAVIQIKDNTGTVLWSWHIWMMEGVDKSENLNTTPVYSHPTVNHSITDPNYMMNVNLGWFDAELLDTPRTVLVRFTQDVTDGKVAYLALSQTSYHSFGGNVFYQWGRKDPIQGFDENYQDRIPPTDPDALVKVEFDESIHTLGFSIRNPNTYIYGHNLSDEELGNRQTFWSNIHYNNLWNSEGRFDKDDVVVKTVYDPCPIGFKIPNRNAYTGFVSDGAWDGTGPGALSDVIEPTEDIVHCNIIGTWRHGFTFARWSGDNVGIFFPATSLREYSTGELRLESYHGYNSWSGHYWTACRLNSSSGFPFNGAYFNFYFIDNVPRMSVIGTLGPESYAFSVRPVVE